VITGRRRLPPLLLAALLLLALPVLVFLGVRVGATGLHDAAHSWRGLCAVLGLGDELPRLEQTILELRLWRSLVAAGVGAAMAYSGSLVQGVFRNGLAAPSIIGVTGGASLGATLAILALSGYGAALVDLSDAGRASFLIPLGGFLGALGATLLVSTLALRGGRLSVSTMLLMGIAVNAAIAGLLSLISWAVLSDWQVSQALQAWTFGTFDDRSPQHVFTLWGGVLLASLVIPRVAWELDLLQGGEEDADALGVRSARVRALCIAAAALAAASAVAVAGQIAFIGLLVPHGLRLLVGSGHRALLPLSILGGAVFMLGIDTAQRACLGDRALQPGVIMALVGGPGFLLLLLSHRQEIDEW